MSKGNEFTLKEVILELKEAVNKLNDTVCLKAECQARHNKTDSKINVIYGWFFSFLAIFIAAFSFIATK